ncbi:uncharacterized protein LOC121631745 [Melanotaenia boesemani]|uniref:uncharacterized protein LOC121631745 n=1 Tax=Melanotaenia boesemani TaxID=1250792 RepID=UPI001C048287|nr:uncharacterized protein LOC121631745 [Melanotaenia boesemani]
MGTGTSRGKKVAPVCVSEVNVTKTASKVASSKQDSNSFKPLKIQSVLRNARIRAQPECHSEGHDSELSGEDDDIHGELDTVLADYEEREKASVKKTSQKKTFIKSKTYGLCHLNQEDTEGDDSSASRLRAEEPRVFHCVPKDVNKRSNSAFTRLRQHTIQSSNQHESFSLTRGTSLEVVPTSEKQASSLTMPVILYDGSEEELMDTIEREFS